MPFEWTVAEAFPDLEPLPQDDGPDPVVQIAYSAEFVATMDIFRRVLAIGEFSERTLRLSAEVIELNAANYTAWQYRRKCLDESCTRRRSRRRGATRGSASSSSAPRRCGRT